MKIVKKILLVIILLALVAVEVWILDNFEQKYLRYGIVDKNENTVVDFNYLLIDSGAIFEGYKNIKAYKADILGNTKEITYIDMKGNEYLIASVKDGFEPIRPYYYEDIARIADGDTGKYGYIDSNGNMITDFKYDIGYDFENGYCKVAITENGVDRYGVINSEGKEILPCKYDSVFLDNADFDVLYADLGDEDYFFDKDGNKIAEYNEDGTITFIDSNDLDDLGKLKPEEVLISKNLFVVSKEGEKVQFFDKKGNLKKDYTSDEATNVSSGELFLISQDGKRSVVDPVNGYSFDPEAIESKGYEICYMENSKIIVKKDDKLGVVDPEGNIIIDTIYDDVSNETVVKGFFSVNQGEKNGVFDIDGNEIIKCTNKDKDLIFGDGEYFVVERNNTKLLAMWITYLAIITILEIIIIVNIFKRKK